MAAYTGNEWGIATQSGTDAITTALCVLGVGTGDRVAVPAYMCSAPLDSIADLNAVAVPVDIDPMTLSMNPDRLDDFNGIAAVIVPHMFGCAADIERIRHERIVEDCAQTLGTHINGRRIGSHGTVAICSFYGTKLLATGHGGMILGRDEAHRKKALDLMQHDNRDSWMQHRHFLMSDLNAALGLSQLQQLPEFIDARRRIAARFTAALDGEWSAPTSVFSRFLIVTDDISQVVEHFSRNDIEVKRPVYKPISHLLDGMADACPFATWAHNHIVSIPIYPLMPESWVARIETCLHELGELGDVRCHSKTAIPVDE